MCGILGVRKSFRPDRADAERALARLRWRGPDGAQLVEVGDWWLGVARLAITDPAHDQPILCPRTSRVVVLNGALTSAADDWPRFGPAARTRNDAELLLLRLEERTQDESDGREMLAGVTGPYAFAIVDPRTDSLWIGRDPMGEKPLWLASDGSRTVAFASTRAALAALDIPTPISDASVSRLLRFGFAAEELDDDGPPRAGASIAVPGLTIERGPATTTGSPREMVVAPALRRGSPPPLAQALRRAVGRCATAEVRVGLALSGGVDSACIAACMDPSADRRWTAYQARADGEPEQERGRARRVASQLGLALVEVDFGPDALEALPKLTREAGQPLGDPSIVAAHALARRAAADGVRVLLSGEGADELLLGYDRHRAIARLPRHGFEWLPAPRLSTSRLARLARALAARDPYDALLEIAPPGFRRQVLSSAARRGDDGLVAALERARPELGAASGLELAQAVDLDAYLRGDLLPKLDVATMAAGIEGRCPFLDPEVLASVDQGRASTRAPGKHALRAAFEDALPTGHFAQRKRGFAVPLDRWWREDDFLPDLLLDARTLSRPHLVAAGVRRMLDLHRQGRACVGHALYALVAFELHLRGVEDEW